MGLRVAALKANGYQGILSMLTSHFSSYFARLPHIRCSFLVNCRENIIFLFKHYQTYSVQQVPYPNMMN